ncbi:UDP-N-acetylmuramate dehydrogenase [Halosquirtibacter laminarini]|uniref:UDP-N-acetylmuramate dehydrogenase n=1 Tax=Halosquirtibacter laminarini TaxID=3374600 RepID=A0AC61NMS0_9BACT|nr:UDP-N-acetylmuramate dehydrogenase [Prolixibacteraceae bacterium]
MIIVKEDFSVREINTFGIDAKTKFFLSFDELDDVEEVNTLLKEQYSDLPFFVVGGGSNLLFTDDFKGLILHPSIQHIRVVEKDLQHVYVEAGAGVDWDEFVGYCVQHGWGGVENLSLIPGVVGAAPVQNIGAYGVEAKDSIESVTLWNLETESIQTLSNESCHFGYRDSIFKNDLKSKIIVLSVRFKLTLQDHLLKLNYGALKELHLGVSIQEIRQKVIDIRESKLPDPKDIGNGGSFFKNPIVALEFAHKLQANFPDLVTYDLPNNTVKLAAGWLIEYCGWKGYRDGAVGVHEKQSLVLVNFGNARGSEIVSLAKKIIRDVYDSFGVTLEPEVIYV